MAKKVAQPSELIRSFVCLCYPLPSPPLNASLHRIDPPVTELPLAVSEIDKLSSEWIYVQKEPKMITAASNLERPAVPTDIPAPPSSQLLVPSHRETHLVPATMLPG
ncbi:hypothetical protein KIN20_016587 [Parelaphostrongylus tenuis]|uniref:Uncharacterized protein n=1 Tax=Parelaphostrongylus tenuis TaxID=148309 RepID=A0AAD5QQW1_PARTN|nr:hypothetical protein KIN20_016560 [Parelaphostrongylus tenuis]KAJ1358224.1 hypothetical protein KIN20_016587 [Parelaphostrongylus tenuis]